LSTQAKSEELNLSEVQAEINKHQRELVAMQSALPASINLGFTALQLVKVGLQCCQHYYHTFHVMMLVPNTLTIRTSMMHSIFLWYMQWCS